jgi:hypothetical protein
MPLWTYRFAPVVDGRVLRVSVAVGWSESRVTVEQDGALLASDTLRFRQEPYRLQQLSVSTAAGDLLVEVGPRTWYTYGLRVRRDDAVLYQSHADPFAYVPKMQAMLRPRRRAATARSTWTASSATRRRSAPTWRSACCSSSWPS